MEQDEFIERPAYLWICMVGVFLKGLMSCDGKFYRKEKKYEEVIFVAKQKES